MGAKESGNQQLVTPEVAEVLNKQGPDCPKHVALIMKGDPLYLLRLLCSRGNAVLDQWQVLQLTAALVEYERQWCAAKLELEFDLWCGMLWRKMQRKRSSIV